MKSPLAASAIDYKLLSSFEEIGRRLLDGANGEFLEKPLAYWTLPKDRRLPYALLDRSVRELVKTPFGELLSTQGIGRKKIAALVMLLERVERQQSAATSPVAQPTSGAADADQPHGFEASVVSESVWAEWRQTVRRHELQDETLGRLAPCLRALPTVIWTTPLRTYVDLCLAEIRDLKTHGDKRLRAILEVFQRVHEVLGRAGGDRQLVTRLLPRFVAGLEHWIVTELAHDRPPQIQELRQNLVLPLLNQIELDAGDQIHRLAAGRLGVEGPPETVRDQSQGMNVTRARVYQLLETCAHVMAVRWPEGRWQLVVLSRKFASLPLSDERRRLLQDSHSLMFPDRQAVAEREPALAEAAI